MGVCFSKGEGLGRTGTWDHHEATLAAGAAPSQPVEERRELIQHEIVYSPSSARPANQAGASTPQANGDHSGAAAMVLPDMINEGLPLECVALILSKLDDPKDWSCAAMVCRRWLLLLPSVIGDHVVSGGSEGGEPEEAATNSRERRSRRASQRLLEDQRRELLSGKDISDMRLICMAVGSAGRNKLGKLEFIDCPNITNAGLAAVCSTAKDLRSVTLTRCKKLTDEGVRELSKCTKLETLRLHLLKVSDAALSAVALSCPALLELAVTECEGITDTSLSKIAEACSKLKRLELNGKVGLTDVGLASFGEGCSTLRNLGLKSSRKVTELGLSKVVAGGSSQCLRTISLNKCPAATDVALVELGRCCKALQTLHLLRCPGFTDAGLQAAATGCTSLLQLMVVDCSGVTNTGLEAVLSGARRLEKLNVSKCTGINEYLASSLSAATTCPSVKFIELSRLSIGDKGLAAILRSCPFVTELDLTRCKKVGDNGIAAVVTACGRSLRDLCLRGCVKVTDKSLAHIASCRLKVLVLSGTAVSDSGLSSLARSACGRSLISLNLSRCMAVTDGCLPLLASNCRSLWQLDVQFCPNVSRKGLKGLTTGRFGAKCGVSHSHPSLCRQAGSEAGTVGSVRSKGSQHFAGGSVLQELLATPDHGHSSPARTD